MGATYTFRLNGVAVPAGDVAGRVYTTTSISQQSTVTVEVSTAGGCSATDDLTVYVPRIATAGTISLNAADAVLCSSGNIANDIASTNPGTLDASSSAGSVLTYQWQERSTNTANVWTNIAGATSSSLDISDTPLNILVDTEIRRLTFATLNSVDCPTGGAGLPSNVVSIDIEEPRNPTITTNPGTTVCAEDVTDLVFTVNTVNTQLTDTYQWAINGVDVTIANGYAQNETGTTYQVDTLGDIGDGDVVTVIVTTAGPDSCPNPSAPVTISVSDAPIANLTSTAVGGVICGGLDGFNQPYADTVTFTAELIAGASYQFFNGPVPLTPVQVSNVFATDDFSIYDTDLEFDIVVEVTNASGCSATDTATISLNYVTADSIQIVGGAVTQNICNATTPTANFESVGAEDAPDGTNDFVDGADYPNGGTITYQWELSTDGGLNWNPVVGATTRTMTPTILYQTTQYRRRSRSILNGINTVPCDNYSNIITINVGGALTGGEVQRNNTPWVDLTETLCPDTAPQLLRVINDTAGPGIDYQWQYSLDNSSWEDITISNGYPINATAAEYQPTAITNTSISSVSSFTITNYADANTVNEDFYRVTIGADVFTVTVGEVFDAAEVGSGASPVDNVDEVLAVLEYKINNSGSGITAVDNAANDNILITLAPGSTLTPVYLISDNGVNDTVAASVSALTYDGEGNTRFYRRSMTQNFGGAILPLCQTFSDVHTVEVNSVIAGKVSNTNLAICYNTIPSAFTSERDAYSTNIGAAIAYQWYRTTDVAMTVWTPIGGATLSSLNFGSQLTQSTSFRRRATSTHNGIDCFTETDPIVITVLDEVQGGFILASQNICREVGSPLTVDVNDLFDIVVNAVETDDGVNDGINYQWQFSVDNNNWDDVIAGDRADLLDGGFAATLSMTTQITAAQLETDVERRLRSIVDPDISTDVYYRLHTTRFNDVNDNDILDSGELVCDVAYSGSTTVTISAQPTLVQTTAPANEQTVCEGDNIDPITFSYGGSATGIRLVNLPAGLNQTLDAAAQTLTIDGIPNGTGFVRVETQGTTCETIRLQHLIRVTTAPQIPDYILIDDVPGGNDPIPIIEDQDGNIYNGQIYLCEQALSTSPSPTTFSACYNDGRVAPLTESYIWYISPPNAGIISATTGYVTWDDGFFGDATISVVAIGCDGSATATLTAEVSVNEFDSSASQPTEPIPLLEAQQERITITGIPVTGEIYNVTLNGVRYSFEVGNPAETAGAVAAELENLIDNDLTSPVTGLFQSASSAFVQGDLNGNGLNDEAGGRLVITAQYDGDSSPAIPPGTPRGYGGDFSIQTSVTPAPLEARAFGFMTDFQLNETSVEICGDLTGSEPICETTATTPDTQYFSTSSFYASIRYAIDNASIIPGVGSVASPGGIVSSTGVFSWNSGFHGTFNIESYATGCDGVENPTPGVHTVKIYPNMDPPADISYDPLTLPDCPAISGETTQFTSSSEVTWSWNNNTAGTINSVTGLVTWADGWSGTVVITATSFGCGGESLSRTVIIPESPSLSRISDITTTNQSACVGSDIRPIRYEILGTANTANVTGIDDLNLFVTPTSENQIDRLVVQGPFPDTGDQYILTINQVPYTVTVSVTDATAAGGAGVADTLEEIVQVFVYQINQANLGITAVNDAPAGQFTLTSNAFDYSISTSLNDIDGDDPGISFTRNIINNGGTFIEISGTISPSLPITAQTTYQYTITTVGGTCTPTTAQGFISVSPNSDMTVRPGIDLGQTICNNSAGVFDPIIYDLSNASTVNVSWSPSRPTGINHTHLFRNQISTIDLGGADGDVAANNGEDYTITINSTTVTYTVDTAAPQSDNEVGDILNGLRTEILAASLPVNATVVGNSLRITSVNAAEFTLAGAGGNAPLQFAASNITQTATNTVSIFGDPAVAGLAVDTTYNFTISTINNAFGCNDPAAQVSATGSITIALEPSIAITSGSNNLIICRTETISSTQGGNDIEWDITGFALGASIGAGQLPAGVQSTYNEIPQITEITFGGNPADFDDNDIVRITVNGVINEVTVNAGAGLDTFDAILQNFEALIDSNVPQVDASFAASTLTLQSNSGDATTVVVAIVDTNVDAADPSINSSVTQANRKFIRIFGEPTDPAGIYNYTISTFGANCDPVTANGTIRVVDSPEIGLSAIPGNNPNPTGVCNLSPMNDIVFDISTFATYTVTWTGVSGQPPGIILARTNSSTVRLVSDPVVNIPGAIPAGGVSYTYEIISTVNSNGCSSVASYTGVINVINGTATLALDVASSATAAEINANGGAFDPSTPPDYVSIEACQNSLLDDVEFDSSADIINVAIVSGNLPSGLFSDFTPGATGGKFRIYGTPDTEASELVVLRAITDACVPAADVRVLIEVFGASSITLDTANDNQTVCNNTAFASPISYTVSNSLGATVVGLPDGLAGNFVAPNNFIISGNVNVPALTETTSYTYTITTINNPGGPLVGACATSTITGVITVRPEESLTIDPLSGSVTQGPTIALGAVCYGENIDPIIINVVGDNTYASVVNAANLPNGINFDFVEDADNMGGVLTISGSPSDAIAGNDPFTYTFNVTTDGPNTSPCPGATQQINITVVPPSSLVYAGADPSVPNQIVCSGTPLTDIEFRIGGGARDISVSGDLFDPALGGFTRAGNIVLNDPANPQNSEIYGIAPIVTSTTTFTYEITTINQCNPGTNEISYSGMITVLPSETISQTLTSGPTVQTVCVNTSIQSITFDVTGQDTRAKFVDASLVPSGISLDFQPNADLNGGLATILGAPDNTNAAGDYTFEITTGVSGAVSNTSICTDQTQEITITVNALPTITFSGADTEVLNQSVCELTAIQDVQFTIGGSANDVTFTSSPAGLGFDRLNNISIAGGNIVTLSGQAPNVAAETTFTYTLETVDPFTCSVQQTFGGSITVFPPPEYDANWTNFVTVTEPTCFPAVGLDLGSIVVDPSAITGGANGINQIEEIIINNSFEVGHTITIDINGESFTHNVVGIDNATGTESVNPAVYDRPQSRLEIISRLTQIINDGYLGQGPSLIVNAVATNPALGTMRLISKNAGFGFNLTVSKAPLASPGTITSATIIANQTNTYSYEWFVTDAAGNITGTTSDTDLTLGNLSVSGTKYYILRTISNGCSIDSPVVQITGPTAVTLTVDTICSTEIDVTASGGSPDYIYQIYNNNGLLLAESGATAGSHTFRDGDSGVAGSTLSISAGNVYQIGVKDTNQCTFGYPANNLITVTTPSLLIIDETQIDVQQADCNGNGSITIDSPGFTITGGSAGNTGDYSNFTFLWQGSTGNTYSTPSVASAPPGDYTLTVTDDLCPDLTATSGIIRILPTEQPVLPNAATSSAPANCSDGHIEVQFTGLTTSTFSYQWTNPQGIVIDSGSNIAPSVDTLRIENLDRGGIYTLEITVNSASAPCVVTQEYSIAGADGPLRMINALASTQANFTTIDITCNGAANGIAITEIAGGNPDYQYSINGGNYKPLGEDFTLASSVVTVTGAVSTTVVSYTSYFLTIENLEGGTYSIKVKDSSGCTDLGGLPVELDLGSFTINEPDPLGIELNASTTQAVDCTNNINGSLGINITGGTTSPTGYSILWQLTGTDGDVIYKRTTRSQNQNGTPNPDGLIITDLEYAGDYTVTVTDAAGCVISEQITLEDGSTSISPFSVGDPTITQPGCNSDELGSIELQLSGGSQPYDIKWYRLAVASDNALSLTSTQTGTPSATVASETIIFSDGGYVSMNKDGFYIIDNLDPGKYKAIIKDNTSCQIFTRTGVIKSSSFNMFNQRVYNREVLDCASGLVEADFSFRLSGTSLAYNIELDGELVYGGGSGQVSGVTVVSPTFASSIIKQGNTFVIRGLTEGRHVVVATDVSNPDCSLDYAFDIETYIPITFEGQTEFEFDICDSLFEFELDTSQIIGGNPIIDDNDNAIYNLRWTYTPLDPNEPGSSFIGRTSFDAGRGTYELIISDGVCESESIEFVFSGEVDVLSIDGLLANGEISQGVSCELGATDGRISIDISGGTEPYNISWEIFDSTNPVPTPSNPASPTNSPWLPLDGSYPGLSNFDGFTTLNDLPAGLYRYTIRSGSTCPNSIDTPFNYFRDVISVDDDNTLVLTDGPYVDPKLCEGLPGLLLLDAVNNSDSDSPLNFFYIDTNGTDDPLDDGAPVPLNGNTTKLDEDTYQILIDTPFEYGKIIITTDEGCGVETEFNLALGEPYFSYTSPSFEQVNEIPAREIVTFTDESEGEFSRLEWNFGDNSDPVNVNISGTASGVTQVNHAYGNSGTYYPTLTIYNEIGCYESVTNPITVGRGYSIYTPNVFTPNNDCLNDFFRPLFTGFESLTFNVYDNKGNLIYTEEAKDGSINRSDCPNTIDPSGNGKSILGWDGKRSDGSTLDSFSPYYIYSIEGIPLNRVTDDQVIERSGIFTVLK